ncbi:MAG: cytidylate kinase-like family protein [Gammaproteobacteria bacterium]
MKCSAERLIDAMIGVDLAKQRKAEQERATIARKATYVVTVSRGYGSRGKQVAQALADRLGVRCCDRTILEEVAKRAAVDVELVAKLDETVRRSSLMPWKAAFTGKTLGEQRYLDHLIKVVLNISKKGGVIVGRGAHLILGPERAFRVRIVGSPDACAARIAEREHIDLAAARVRVRTVDEERAGYLQKLYGSDIKDCSDYDFVINSDRFSIEQMVDMILGGMRQAGFEIPPDILQAG